MVADLLRSRPDVRSLPAALSLATIAAQLLWPFTVLFWSSVERLHTIGIVLLFAAASLAHAVRSAGPPAALALLGVGAIGFCAEIVGVRTGHPFGSYSYADTLGPSLAGVPLLIGAAWTMFAWPAALAARRLVGGLVPRVLVGAWALTAWDLFLDPQMVDAGHWTWTFPSPHLPGVLTVPLTNLAGWMLVSLVVSALLQAALDRYPPADDTWPLALFLWTYFGSIFALAVFLWLPAAAFWGAVGLGVVAVPLVLKLWRTWSRA